MRMPDTVRFRLAGDRAPARHHAPEVAERSRRATLGQARRLYGAGGVPAVLSGHDGGSPGPGRGHGHAFWLPEDADGDGRLDHLTVHVPAMDGAALAALLAADIAIHSRRESWRAQWHWIGGSGDGDAPGPLLGSARTWISLSPYVGPWHEKPRFSPADMLRRECRARGLPSPLTIEPTDAGAGADERAAPRWRWRRSAPPGAGRGTRWRLAFGAPVRGPLALGYGCHFGLGLFGAERGDG